MGGTVDAGVNISQLDPAYLSLGTALQQPVPNPFFGIPQFGVFGAQPTITRGQLLRPYPQFGQVRAHRVSDAHARYDALSIGLERRHHQAWSGRVNYVYSVRKDNQFGEGNAFVLNQPTALDNNDLEREFGYSLIDAPHRLNISGTFELPFGTGKRWLTQGGLSQAVAGGWAISAVGFYQSGFPIAVSQSTNAAAAFGFGQRPNVVTGAVPGRDGSADDNYDPGCACIRWLNPAGWTGAAAFTLGGAPRTDARVRSPLRTNWDLGFHKTVPIGTSRLTIRAEIINLFDDPAFFSPASHRDWPISGRLLASVAFRERCSSWSSFRGSPSLRSHNNKMLGGIIGATQVRCDRTCVP